MNAKLIITLFLVLALGLQGCVNPRAQDQGTAQITLGAPESPQMGPVDLSITLLDAQGNPVDGADVRVTGDMSHAGMEAVHAVAHSMGEGKYNSQGFVFTMAGDWIITVDANLPDGSKASKTFNLDGVRGDTMAHDEDHESMDDDAMAHDESMEHHDTLEIPEGDPLPSVSVSAVDQGEGMWHVLIETTMSFSEGTAYVPGQGHAHLYLDDQLLEMVYSPDVMQDLSDFPAGTHELRVELSSNDHRAYTYHGQKLAASTLIQIE